MCSLTKHIKPSEKTDDEVALISSLWMATSLRYGVKTNFEEALRKGLDILQDFII